MAEDEYSHYYDAYIRDGQWLLWVSIDFNIDTAIGYYEANEDFLEGSVEDYLSYPFSPDELQQWMNEEYVPQTHAAIAERVVDE